MKININICKMNLAHVFFHRFLMKKTDKNVSFLISCKIHKKRGVIYVNQEFFLNNVN